MASIFRQTYTVKDENGKRVRKKSKFWYIDFKTADSTRKRLKGFKDKQATAQLAAKLEREAELAQRGIVDKYAEHRRIALRKHLDDFKQNLLDRGNTEKYAKMTYNRAKDVINGCNFIFIADVSASQVQSYLANKRRAGLGKKTSNYYLKATKQLFSWMKSDSRIGENPLECIGGINTQTEKKRDRRALTHDEQNKLIETALKSNAKHQGLKGRERAMLYLLAADTGFRANELGTLSWESFDFDKSGPTVTVTAAYSKCRKEKVQPIRSDVAELFRQWHLERNEGKDKKVFRGFKYIRWADMLKEDLEVAGIPYLDDAGRVADFHALRHTYITNLVKGGASPKVVQSLARHSKITLTMDTYTHISLYDERGALDGLPDLSCLNKNVAESNEAAELKTGTDNQSVGAYKKLTKKSDFNTNSVSLIGTDGIIENTNLGGIEDFDKSLQMATLGAKEEALSVGVTGKTSNEAEGTRTLNLRIDSPML